MGDFVAGDMVIIDWKTKPKFGIIDRFIDQNMASVDIIDGRKNCWYVISDLILHPHSGIHHAISGTRYLRSIGRG